MKKTLLLLILIFLMVVPCGCKSSDYKQATEYMKNGNYEEAAIIYRILEDYKNSEELATMLKVKILMERYQKFYDEMGTLCITNYDFELAPLVQIISDFNQLDMEGIGKYPELDEYVQDVKVVNEGIEGIIDVDHESISKFFGPGFYMFPSTMALSIKQSELIFRSTLKTMLAVEFPYKEILEGIE